MIRENLLEPRPAVIERVEKQSRTAKTFTLRFRSAKEQRDFWFMPGKFVEVSIFGIGEMPISICSSPLRTDTFQLTVAGVGETSRAMLRLGKGDEVGVRGPYGKPFPVPAFRKKNIVVVAGGMGLAPLRSLLHAAIPKSEHFGKIMLFYGAREPSDMIFRHELKRWQKLKAMDVFITVDKPSCGWRGGCGLVTDLFGKTEIPRENTVAVMCGPPPMLHFSAMKLEQNYGISPKDMYASLERQMHCGIGKCAHCNIGNRYTCIDGPVFTIEEIRKFAKEA